MFKDGSKISGTGKIFRRLVDSLAHWPAGRLAPRLAPRLTPRLAPRLIWGSVVLCGVMVALDSLLPPPLKSIPVGLVVTDHQGQWLNAFPVQTGMRAGTWRFEVDPEEIDRRFLERLVLIEDKRFWSHPGVDPIAIVRAGISSFRAGRVVSGASTITMQTARLLEPRPRTFRSKFIEMMRALQIERRLKKQEILSLYLTLAPYGGNIEGVRAASLFYFGKEPAYLSLSEQALLIAIPQAPEARAPEARAPEVRASEAGHPDIGERAAKQGYRGTRTGPAQGPAQGRIKGPIKGRALVLKKLLHAGHISEQAYAEALGLPLPRGRHQLPRLAWHETFARSRKQQSVWSAAGSSGLALMLDAGIQRSLERIINTAFEKNGQDANFAALVIDNKTRALRGSVGSASLGIEGGWLDMTRAVRSPGSTLKPFIYAMAFEAGHADENTLLEDVTQSFSGYSPENFTRVFHGDVTVSQALQHSLNIPAVLALDHIGAARFTGTLQATGVKLKAPDTNDAQTGLAVALGGVGITARDLGRLYAALADDGRVRHLRAEITDRKDAGHRLVSEDHRQKLRRIMATAPSVAGRMPARLARHAPEVAFKTGTSYGFRDAWAVGYTDQYTALIWTGHANGQPRPGKTGRKAALPILFDIFDMLDGRQPPPSCQDDKPEGPKSQKKMSRVAIPSRDDFFRTGTALTHFKTPKTEEPPEIIFPQDGVELFSRRFRPDGAGSAAGSAAPARADSDGRHKGYVLAARGGSGGYQWYVDGVELRRHPDGRVRWVPELPGFYELWVVDTRGKGSRARVSVRS